MAERLDATLLALPSLPSLQGSQHHCRSWPDLLLDVMMKRLQNSEKKQKHTNVLLLLFFITSSCYSSPSFLLLILLGRLGVILCG